MDSVARFFFLAPLVDRAARRIGVRTTMAIGFALMTASLTGLAIIGDATTPGIALWLLGATAGGMLDVLGNIPFVRLVKPRERAAMASVFSTWREASFLIAPALAASTLDQLTRGHSQSADAAPLASSGDIKKEAKQRPDRNRAADVFSERHNLDATWLHVSYPLGSHDYCGMTKSCFSSGWLAKTQVDDITPRSASSARC